VSETGLRRVVITGLGAVSCVGIGVDAFTEAIKQGRNGASPIRSFDTTEYRTSRRRRCTTSTRRR